MSNNLNDPSDVWPPPIADQTEPKTISLSQTDATHSGSLSIVSTIVGASLVLYVHWQMTLIPHYVLFFRLLPVRQSLFVFRHELTLPPYCILLYFGYLFLGIGLVNGILKHTSRRKKFGLGLAIALCSAELIWRIMVAMAPGPMSVYMY